MEEKTQELPLALQGFSEEEKVNIGKLQFASMLLEIVSRTGNYYGACINDLEINSLESGLEKYLEEFDLVLSAFQEKVLKIALQAQCDLLE